MPLRHCKARTQTGKACPNKAGESGYCFTHDPARKEERTAARRKGGENRRIPHGRLDSSAVPSEVRSPEDTLKLLDYTLSETLVMDNTVGRAKILVAIAAAYNEAIKTSDQEKRIAALEEFAKIKRS